MEWQDPEDNSQIEVLDGQMSVEELLADLGFEWRPGPSPSGAGDAPAADIFGQPALF
ncbi:hypothetical protein ACLH0K_01990 [Arthrobacter sp. MPF02]|uniref:hypothetical protein n=1 Tax=Arthrobacter sp. MPF02 TaxID=3388492 RepID=UPI0039855A57